MRSVGSLRSLAVCVVTCVAVTVGCSGDDDQASQSTLPATTAATTPATTSSTTLAPSTTAVPTTTIPVPPTTPPAPPTTAPATAPASTAPAPATTTPASECEALDGTEAFNDGFPMRMSGMVGSDIRTGAHECFERVVIEFAGPGDPPGVRVEYVDDPVLLSPSDETVDIDGDATLVISVAAWMPSMEGGGYDGPKQFVPTNVSHILEVRQIENFEGLSAWAIGLDSERDFSAYFLESPPGSWSTSPPPSAGCHGLTPVTPTGTGRDGRRSVSSLVELTGSAAEGMR